MQHKYSLNSRQIRILEELMEADAQSNGVCFQDKAGKYEEQIKQDINFLKTLGFITEYTSEAKLEEDHLITWKGWTITYHGIAFLFAFHTPKKL